MGSSASAEETPPEVYRTITHSVDAGELLAPSVPRAVVPPLVLHSAIAPFVSGVHCTAAVSGAACRTLCPLPLGARRSKCFKRLAQLCPGVTSVDELSFAQKDEIEPLLSLPRLTALTCSARHGRLLSRAVERLEELYSLELRSEPTQKEPEAASSTLKRLCGAPCVLTSLRLATVAVDTAALRDVLLHLGAHLRVLWLPREESGDAPAGQPGNDAFAVLPPLAALEELMLAPHWRAEEYAPLSDGRLPQLTVLGGPMQVSVTAAAHAPPQLKSFNFGGLFLHSPGVQRPKRPEDPHPLLPNLAALAAQCPTLRDLRCSVQGPLSAVAHPGPSLRKLCLHVSEGRAFLCDLEPLAALEMLTDLTLHIPVGSAEGSLSVGVTLRQLRQLRSFSFFGPAKAVNPVHALEGVRQLEVLCMPNFEATAADAVALADGFPRLQELHCGKVKASVTRREDADRYAEEFHRVLKALATLSLRSVSWLQDESLLISVRKHFGVDDGDAAAFGVFRVPRVVITDRESPSSDAR